MEKTISIQFAGPEPLFKVVVVLLEDVKLDKGYGSLVMDVEECLKVILIDA